VLIGEKTALNEFVAYLHLAQMLQGGEELSARRSVVIATYALAASPTSAASPSRSAASAGSRRSGAATSAASGCAR
jgi:hypothetical protein